MDPTEAYKKQAETIAYYQEHDPAAITRTRNWREADMLKEISADLIPQNKPLGYLRFHPADFLVEEVLKNGEIILVNDLTNDVGQSQENNGNTIYAHLIKLGIPTDTAITRIAAALNISKDKIGSAGLKDAEAVTAQAIAFPNTKISMAEICQLNLPQIILSHCTRGKGSFEPGDLQKNIFTITVRTQQAMDNDWFDKQMQAARNGILNYFHYQRFGGLRLLSHRLGKLIMQGKYEEAIKLFLCQSNEYDIPLIGQLRARASELYPNWGEIKQEFKKMPYTLFHELCALEFLQKDPSNFMGALGAISDQTQMWAYAYASWLFNRHLSESVNSPDGVEEKVPLLLSNNLLDYRIYQKYLKADSTEDFITHLKPFHFIPLRQRFVDSYIYPEIIDYKIIDKKTVINFALPKGAYATNFLANVFELCQGHPVPEWVEKDEFDVKEILGQGSLGELKERFKEFWRGKVSLE